jgi:hypothetical protein
MLWEDDLAESDGVDRLCWTGLAPNEWRGRLREILGMEGSSMGDLRNASPVCSTGSSGD